MINYQSFFMHILRANYTSVLLVKNREFSTTVTNAQLGLSQTEQQIM